MDSRIRTFGGLVGKPTATRSTSALASIQVASRRALKAPEPTKNRYREKGRKKNTRKKNATLNRVENLYRILYRKKREKTRKLI
jgi:hypothetical protein